MTGLLLIDVSTPTGGHPSLTCMSTFRLLSCECIVVQDSNETGTSVISDRVNVESRVVEAGSGGGAGQRIRVR